MCSSERKMEDNNKTHHTCEGTRHHEIEHRIGKRVRKSRGALSTMCVHIKYQGKSPTEQ
jgi:hypothetical protein